MADEKLSPGEPIYSPAPGEAQFTFRAILVGSISGCLVSAINVYFGLKTGLSFGGALIAAIIGFTIFKILPAKKEYTVLENLITETVGSAASGVVGALGISSVLPALYLLGHAMTTGQMYIWCVSVTFLGVFFAVPLRHKMIIVDKLRFPTGIAAAESIRTLHSATGDGMRKSRVLLVVSLLTGAYMLAGNFFPGLRESNVFDFFGLGAVTALGFVLYLSPALLGSGMLVGVRIGASALLGAIIAWGIISPLIQNMGLASGLRDSHHGVVAWLLWPAITLIVVESITSILLDSARIFRAAPNKDEEAKSCDKKAVEEAIPLGWWLTGVSAFSVLNIYLMHRFFHISILLTIVAIALTWFMSLITARALGQTDIGAGPFLGKLNQALFASLSPGQPINNLMTGSITTGIATAASDLLQDWKTGFLLGASPRKQLWAQLVGLVIGVFTAIPIFILFLHAHTLGSDELPAPVAFLYKAISEVLAQGVSALPPYTGYAVICACVVGIVTPIFSKYTRIGAKYAPNLLGVGIAFILPPAYCITLFAGAWIAALWAKRKPDAVEYILIAASGLIIGESFVEIANVVLSLFIGH